MSKRNSRKVIKAPNRFPRPGGAPVVSVAPGDFIGVDEAGRGCLAGPLIICACAIKTGAVDGVRDSKTIARDKIPELARQVEYAAIAYKIAVMSPKYIDDNGIDKAWDKGVCEVIKHIRAECDWDIIIDGNVLPSEGERLTAFPKADSLVYQASAASVLAKAKQVALMAIADANYPMYKFSEHCGYCTRGHEEVLKKYGPCPIHRKSFRPVANPEDPLGKEELKNMTAASTAMMLKSLDGIETSRFASLWEQQFVAECRSKMHKNGALSTRDLFFLRAVSRRRGK